MLEILSLAKFLPIILMIALFSVVVVYDIAYSISTCYVNFRCIRKGEDIEFLDSFALILLNVLFGSLITCVGVIILTILQIAAMFIYKGMLKKQDKINRAKINNANQSIKRYAIGLGAGLVLTIVVYAILFKLGIVSSFGLPF